MELSVKFVTVNSGWAIVYIKGLLFKKNVFLSLKMDFIVAYSADPDATFHLGLHCLLKYSFRGFWSTKG